MQYITDFDVLLYYTALICSVDSYALISTHSTLRIILESNLTHRAFDILLTVIGALYYVAGEYQFTCIHTQILALILFIARAFECECVFGFISGSYPPDVSDLEKDVSGGSSGVNYNDNDSYYHPNRPGVPDDVEMCAVEVPNWPSDGSNRPESSGSNISSMQANVSSTNARAPTYIHPTGPIRTKTSGALRSNTDAMSACADNDDNLSHASVDIVVSKS
jgi:hypothetical protein